MYTKYIATKYQIYTQGGIQFWVHGKQQDKNLVISPKNVKKMQVFFNISCEIEMVQSYLFVHGLLPSYMGYMNSK